MNVKKQVRGFGRWNGWLWLLGVMTAGLAGAMLSGGGRLYWGPADSDLVNSFYPYHVFIHRWLMRGVVAFWDPHVFSGYPTLETQQMLALNPVHILSQLLPAEWGLPLQMALHTTIAALGMAWGLRRWNRMGWMAASVGGAVWALGALFAVRVAAGHFTVIAAIAWWPLAVLGFMRLVRGGMQRRTLAATIAAHAMVCLAGGPQYLVYLFYIDAAAALAVMRRRQWRRPFGVGLAVWIYALMLSAPQWLPAMSYLPYSGRAHASSMSGLSLMPLKNLWLETLLPYPFGDDIYTGHLHFKNVWETATYPGMLALLFSAAVICRQIAWLARARSGTFRRGITPVGLAGSLILVAALYMTIGGWLPGFSGFREPTKARAMAAFAVALMSAAALEGIARRPVAWRLALRISAAVLLVALFSARKYSGGVELRQLVESFGPPMDPAAGQAYLAMLDDPGPAAQRFATSHGWATIVLCLGVLAMVILKKHPKAGLAILALTAMADPCATHARNWLPRHPWKLAALPQPVADYFAPKIAQARTAGDLPWRVMLSPGIINRTHHMDGLYEYLGYDPLMPFSAVNRLYVSGMGTLTGDSQRIAARGEAARRAGIRHDAGKWIVSPDGSSQAGLDEILTHEGAALFEITRDVTSAPLDENIFGPDVNGVSFVAEDVAKALADAAPATTAAESLVALPACRPDTWGVRVNLSAPALLLWKSTWLPGWRVNLDDKSPRTALRVNNWMCGALVPAGQHEVWFSYRPRFMAFSIAMLVMGFYSLLGYAIRPLRFRKKPSVS